MHTGLGKLTLRRAGAAILAAAFVTSPMAGFPGSASAKQAETGSSGDYQSALSSFEYGDYSAAAIQLKNVLQKNPANLAARILIGRAYLHLGDPTSAEKELRRARAEGADEELLIVPLAKAMFALKRCKDVIEELAVSKRSAEVEGDLRVVRGRCFLSLGELTDAEKEFQQAESLRPDAATPKIGLARVNLSRGDTRAAKNRIEQALAADSDNSYAWFIKGMLARRMGDIRSARESFDRSVALNPDDLLMRIARAQTLIDAKDLDGALPDLAILKEKAPNHPYTVFIEALVEKYKGDEAGYQFALDRVNTLLRGIKRERLLNDSSLLLLAGIVNYELKNYNDARNYLREHVARDKYNAKSRILLGRILLRRGAVNDALSMFRAAADLQPSNPEIVRLIGISQMRLGQYTLATKAFEKAIELAPNVGNLRTGLALSLLQRGEAEEAVASLKAALDSTEDIVGPAMLLGQIRLREGKYDEALRVFKLVQDRQPDNPLVYNFIAFAEWKMGNAAKARQSLEHAVELYPNYVAAHRSLARMDLKAGNIAAAKARLRSMFDMPGAGVLPLFELARIAEREGDLQEAVSLLTKARDKAPDNQTVWLKLISLLERNGDGGAALRAARKLYNKNPDDPVVLEAFGKAELAFGQAEAAVIAFQRLANATPDIPNRQLHVARLQIQAADLAGAHATLKHSLVSHETDFGLLEAVINVETDLKLYDDALLRTDQLIKMFPRSAIGYRLRGDILYKLQDFPAAETLYAEAIEREPTGNLYLKHYRTQRKVGIDRPSLKGLEKWIADHPKDYFTRRTLAMIYMDIGATAKARTLHEALASERSDDPVILNNLAWLYFEAGDPRASEMAERAYRSAPKMAPILDTLGWILVQKGDSARGLQLLREAFVRDSREPTYRFHLAVALSREGEIKEAKKHLKTLLSTANISADLAAKSRALLASL